MNENVKRFTHEEREKIEHLIRVEKKNSLEIANILGRNVYSISNEIKYGGGIRYYSAEKRQKQLERNVSMRGTRTAKLLSKEQIDEIIRLRSEGRTTAYLSYTYGLSHGRIRRILQKAKKRISPTEKSTRPIDDPNNDRIQALESQVEMIFEILKEMKNDSKN